MRRFFLSLTVLLLFSGVAHAQNTGQVLGRVTDNSGAVVPGATVTLSSPVLLQPLVAVTSATGTYIFPGIPIGTYSVRFELPGFSAVVNENIRIESGFSAQINVQFALATIEQSVIVTGESPVVDVRSTTQSVRFDAETLQNIPTARDSFTMMGLVPGVAIDRQNVGGATAGAESRFISRGADYQLTQWNIDGVDTSSATGGSNWSDFDSYAEFRVMTGGGDVAMQGAGTVIDMVLKSGTDRFRGSARYYFVDRNFISTNLSDALRQQGAFLNEPLLKSRNKGFEVGGPIRTGRAWFWGGVGRQNYAFGVDNFYQDTGDCAPIAANPLGYSVAQVRDCLNANYTTIGHAHYKISARPFQGNQLTLTNTYNSKIESLRGGDDLHPPETTTRLRHVPNGESRGGVRLAPYWISGWPVLWKFGDQHIFNDRWLVDLWYSHQTKATEHAPSSDDLLTVQPEFEISTGAWRRSFSSDYQSNPFNTAGATTNYFLPGKWGGDHSIKAAYIYHTQERFNGVHMGGDAVARFNSSTAAVPAFSVPFSAQIYRDNIGKQLLYQHSAYIQDSYSHNRLTVNLGVRWDRQDDKLFPMTVPAPPFQGQVTRNGTVFDLLPAVNFPGARGGVVWNVFAPRLGATYDLTGNGKTVLKASFARYYDQRATAQLANALNTIGTANIEFPWQDLNGDRFVQTNEIDISQLLSFGGGYNPADPAQTVSPNRIDPNIKSQRTGEFVVGLSRELAPNVGVDISYIWRKYDHFIWQQRIGLSSANYTPVTFTPAAGACPASARCETVTYYVPDIPLPAAYVLTNQPDYYRSYQGFEAVLRKRLSQRWMMNASFGYNDTKSFYTSPDSYQDPTNISILDGAQYAPAVSGSASATVFLNARWIARLNGSYELPWYGIGAAASYDLRQGYAYLPSIQTPNRPNRAGRIEVLLDPPGTVRMPTFQNLDFRVDKTFTFRTVKLQTVLDIFNVFNAGTVLSQRWVQNAANANRVFSTLQPRVARFGFYITF